MKAKLGKEEHERIKLMSIFEKLLRSKGYQNIAGTDEVGRGPLAGPVVAAACILPPNFRIAGLNDSKLVTPLLREKIYRKLINHPKVIYGIGIVDAKMIDEVNILRASLIAMQKAISNLSCVPDYLLVDGGHLPDVAMPAEAIIKGDSHSISIAAASIIAKCTRDHIMDEAHQCYPMYFFHEHKGYGTEKHLEMLKLHGPCPIHRYSYEPIRALLAGKDLSSYAIDGVDEIYAEIS